MELKPSSDRVSNGPEQEPQLFRPAAEIAKYCRRVLNEAERAGKIIRYGYGEVDAVGSEEETQGPQGAETTLGSVELMVERHLDIVSQERVLHYFVTGGRLPVDRSKINLHGPFHVWIRMKNPNDDDNEIKHVSVACQQVQSGSPGDTTVTTVEAPIVLWDLYRRIAIRPAA